MDGWKNHSATLLQLFCFSSPPSCISDVAPSLTLSSRLSLTQYIIQSLSLSPLFFLPTYPPPTLSLSLSHYLSLPAVALLCGPLSSLL